MLPKLLYIALQYCIIIPLRWTLHTTYICSTAVQMCSFNTHAHIAQAVTKEMYNVSPVQQDQSLHHNYNS